VAVSFIYDRARLLLNYFVLDIVFVPRRDVCG